MPEDGLRQPVKRAVHYAQDKHSESPKVYEILTDGIKLGAGLGVSSIDYANLSVSTDLK